MISGMSLAVAWCIGIRIHKLAGIVLRVHAAWLTASMQMCTRLANANTEHQGLALPCWQNRAGVAVLHLVRSCSAFRAYLDSGLLAVF